MNSTQTIHSSTACGETSSKTITYLDIHALETPFEQTTRIVVINRNEKFESKAPDNTKGFEWTTKYGFAGIYTFRLVDGLNEKGLSFTALPLEETIYQEVPYGKNDKAMSMLKLGEWILGSFKTVAEVENALKSVLIWGQEVTALKEVPKLQFAIQDAKGNRVMIKILKGEVSILSNQNGICSNDPQLLKELENLNKYDYSPSESSKAQSEEGVSNCGLKNSVVGTYKEILFSTSLAEGEEALETATKIQNKMDISISHSIVNMEDTLLYDTISWVVVKDLSKKIIRIRPQHNKVWRRIDLTQIPLTARTWHPEACFEMNKPIEINITSQLSTVPNRINNIGSNINMNVLSQEGESDRNLHGSVKKEFQITSSELFESLILSFFFFLSLDDFF